MSDTRSALLATCGKRRFTTVPIGDRDVRIRSLTSGEYSRIESKLTSAVMSGKGGAEAKQEKGMAEANALLIQLCVCDDDGNLCFTKEDLPQLRELDNSVSATLVDACQKFSGIDNADLETLAKNSAEMSPTSSE